MEKLQENLETLQQDSEIALQNERQTVAILVNEKTHLSAELQKREHYESRVSFVNCINLATHFYFYTLPDAKVVEDLLEAERMKTDDFSNEIQKLQNDVQTLSEQTQQSQEKEKALAERCKEQVILLSFPFQVCSHLRYQERQLQYANASASDSRKEMEKLLRKVRELEEQMQSDDRVERLENSLKNMQDRADELEFQLSKLKPVKTFIYYFHYYVSVVIDVIPGLGACGFEVRTGHP